MSTVRLNEIRQLRLNSFVDFAIIGFQVLLVCIPFLRIGADLWHESLHLTPAIAIKDGYRLYSDVLSWYGPIYPMLLSLWMHVAADTAISIRVLDCIQFLVICNLLFFIGRKILRLGRIASHFIITVWLSLAYFIYGAEWHPWPSVTSLAQQLLFLFFLYLALTQKRLRALYLIVSGICLALLLFTRLNVGIYSLILCTCVTILFFKTLRSSLPWILAGLITTFTFITIYLMDLGSFEDFFHQSVLLPKQYFTSSAELGPEAWNSSRILWRYLQIGILGSLAVIFLIQMYTFVSRKISINFDLLLKRNVVVLVSFLVGTLTASLGFFFLDSLTSLFYPRVLVVISMTCLLFSVSYLLLNIKSIFLKNDADEVSGFLRMITMSMGLAGIFQVWPTNDARHLWWGMPILLFFASAIAFERFSFGANIFLFKFVGTFAASFIFCVAVGSGLNTLNVEHKPIVGIPQFKGQEVSPLKARELESIYDFLTRYLGARKSFFLCGIGEVAWISSYNGKYISKSPWYLDMSWVTSVPNPSNIEPAIGDLVVACSNSQGIFMEGNKKYKLIASTNGIQSLNAPVFTISIYRKIAT